MPGFPDLTAYRRPCTARVMFVLAALSLILAAATERAAAQIETKWSTLSEVELLEVEEDGNMRSIPRFPETIRALDGKQVYMSGYMIPLGFAEEQDNFLLSAWPGDGCYFHMPGGPESIVEIRAAEMFDFSYDTIAMTGTLELVEDDPFGLIYRMVDARPADGD
ncbi:MAG: DUF3299 domain-containing protein [Rhodothermales bacterium]|nr:DUF3299 domain-containing protein [Rhodothermales bacterium]